MTSYEHIIVNLLPWWLPSVQPLCRIVGYNYMCALHCTLHIVQPQCKQNIDANSQPVSLVSTHSALCTNSRSITISVQPLCKQNIGDNSCAQKW